MLPVVKKVRSISSSDELVGLSYSTQATDILLNDPALDHEYLPITGLPEFTSAAARLILGPDSPALLEGRVSSVQTISGTGANHLGAAFLNRFYRWNDGPKVAYVSDPTWGKCCLALILSDGLIWLPQSTTSRSSAVSALSLRRTPTTILPPLASRSTNT